MEKSVKGRRGGRGGKSGRGGGGVPGLALVLLVEGPGLSSIPERKRRLKMTERGRGEERKGGGQRGQWVSGCQAETH